MVSLFMGPQNAKVLVFFNNLLPRIVAFFKASGLCLAGLVRSQALFYEILNEKINPVSCPRNMKQEGHCWTITAHQDRPPYCWRIAPKLLK